MLNTSINNTITPFCTSSISTSMNTVIVGRKQVTYMYRWLKYKLHYGDYLVQCNNIHEKLQAFVSSDNQSSNNRGCTALYHITYCYICM